MSLSTLPQISFKLGVSLDALRELVRGNPQLRALGTVVGANKGYAPNEVEQIKIALAEKQKAKKRNKAAAQ